MFVGGNSNYRLTHTVSYNQISFLSARLQLVWVLTSCEFYSITWRMISRSAGYKIHFRKQPPFRRNFFPLVWYLSFLWISTPWQFVHGSRALLQLIKPLRKLWVSVSAISLSSQKHRCFNNVILHLNEIIKNAVVIRNYSRKFIQRWWGKLLCRSAWENHGNSWLTSTKTQVSTERRCLRGRVLVVTAVIIVDNVNRGFSLKTTTLASARNLRYGKTGN